MKSITKKVMEQYEQIRKSGACNMYDYPCVVDVANWLDLYELSILNKKEYIYMISHYSNLMKKFKLERR